MAIATKNGNARFAILLSALLLAAIFMVWNKEAAPAKSETERCAAIENQLRQGVGLNYEDHKYRTEHCVRFDQ